MGRIWCHSTEKPEWKRWKCSICCRRIEEHQGRKHDCTSKKKLKGEQMKIRIISPKLQKKLKQTGISKLAICANSLSICHSLRPLPLAASYTTKIQLQQWQKRTSRNQKQCDIKNTDEMHAPGQVQVVLRPVLPEESFVNELKKFVSQHNFQILWHCNCTADHSWLRTTNFSTYRLLFITPR